jgi:phosphatidylglycerol:prolipoprotein diacylglycerol transferase
MVPVLIHLGPLTLYSFGAMMALAFMIAGYVISIDLEHKGLDPEHAWSIVLWAAIGGILGSRLFVIFGDWRGFLAEPLSFILTGAGFVWYGGLFGGLVSVSYYLRREKIPWLVGVDCIAPALALGHAIGRIGCQVSGDGDWGPATNLPWAMSYPKAIIGWSVWLRGQGLDSAARVHPAPVYETLAYSAIFLTLWRLRDRGLRDGSMLWLYLVLSSIVRFLVEFVRVEPVLAGGLTEAQWIGIPLALTGVLMLVSPIPGRKAAG